MNDHSWKTLSVIVITMGAFATGCKSSGAGVGGSGGSGGNATGGSTTKATTATSATSTTSTTDAASVTATSGTGMPTCMGVLTPNACNDCLVANCCAEVGQCAATMYCMDCVAGIEDPNLCVTVPEADDYAVCQSDKCASECSANACDAPAVSPSNGACFGALDPATKPCNPVTNEGCTAGQACDVGNNGYECYDPPNDQMLCQPCGAQGYCAGGMTCTGTCAKFCCDDGDCGTGHCDVNGLGGGVGICVK